LRVVVVDPSNYTPYYCDRLCAAIAPRLDYVALAASEYSWDELAGAQNYDRQFRFYRLSSRLQASRIRIVSKALEHGVDWGRLLPWMRRQGIQVAHLQWTTFPPVDYASILALKRLGIPVVYTAHNLLPHVRYSGDILIYRALYNAVDHIIVHNQRSAADLARMLRTGDHNVSVIPPGPDLAVPAAQDRDSARRALGLNPESTLLLFFGSLRRDKGLEVLLDAFRSLHAALPHTRLLIAGRPRYPLPAAALDQSGVILDLRYIPTAAAANYYLSADLLVLPYLAATHSSVLLNALAMGRPVVVSDVGGLAENVGGGEGLVVPPGDSEALFAVLHTILAHPAQLQALAARAASWSARAASWEQAAARTVDVYREVRRAR
jgi:D-inositol-3-phosphate glycosyltransferase